MRKNKIVISKLGDYFGFYFVFRNLLSNGGCFIVPHKQTQTVMMLTEITHDHIHLTSTAFARGKLQWKL